MGKNGCPTIPLYDIAPSVQLLYWRDKNIFIEYITSYMNKMSRKVYKTITNYLHRTNLFSTRCHDAYAKGIVIAMLTKISIRLVG